MNAGSINTGGGLTLAAAGKAAYREAVASYNLASEISPGFAATAKSIAEVRAILAAARERGLQVRVHATGHASGAASPYDDEDVLIRVQLAGAVTPKDPTMDMHSGLPLRSASRWLIS